MSSSEVYETETTIVILRSHQSHGDMPYNMWPAVAAHLSPSCDRPSAIKDSMRGSYQNMNVSNVCVRSDLYLPTYGHLVLA